MKYPYDTTPGMLSHYLKCNNWTFVEEEYYKNDLYFFQNKEGRQIYFAIEPQTKSHLELLKHSIEKLSYLENIDVNQLCEKINETFNTLNVTMNKEKVYDNQIQKNWGFCYPVFQNDSIQINRIWIEPGGYCSIHKHLSKNNIFVVEFGQLDVHLLDEAGNIEDIIKLQTGEKLDIQPLKIHQFHNKTSKECVVYEIYYTNIKIDDIFRKSKSGVNK